MLESRYLTDIIFYTAHPKCGERVFCHCIDLSDMDLCKLVCEGFHKEGYTHRTYYLQREDRVYTRLGHRLCNRYMSEDVKDFFEENLKPWYDAELSEGGPWTYNFLDGNDPCKVATDLRTCLSGRNKSWLYNCGMFRVLIVEHKFDSVTGERVYVCDNDTMSAFLGMMRRTRT